MKLNIKNLRRKVIKSFVPIGEALRKEGALNNEIVGAFNNHVKAKVRNYYNLNHNGISIDLKDLKKADSKAEAIFYNKLIEEKISFKFQYEIAPYRVDFLVSDFLIVEIDGPHHKKQREYDKKRDKYLKAYGYKVLRYPIWLVAMDVNAVIEQIREENGKI